MDIVPAGVVTGDNLMKLMEYCRDNAVSYIVYCILFCLSTYLPAQCARKFKKNPGHLISRFVYFEFDGLGFYVLAHSLYQLFAYSLFHFLFKLIQIALPAFNCTSTSTINAVLQAARDVKSPVIIQFSNGGAAFVAGKGIKNDKQKAAILGSIAGAQHVRLMAKHYGIPVIIHSDHCAKKLLEWFDGMLEADEAYFKVLKISNEM